MDIAFFDPDRSHADHLRAALEATVAADARRAARYAAIDIDIVNANDDDDDDCHRLLWPRGATPDDVRAAYDERLDAAMRELREATAESEEEEEAGGCVQPLPRVAAGGGGGAKGWERKGELVTPPSSGDEGEGEGQGRLGKRKRGCGGEEEACEGGGGAKRMRVDTDVARFGRHLATPQYSPKRRAHASRRILRGRMCNTHAMTTRSKARKSGSSG